ncbi:unnamed protein product [Xylocopa violacea]|uniref:Uncharacterized protein n=1 Tax=Xylocopa violacea TaxID=135666 RepID=A0ABP1NFK0_XYLVO
MPLGFTQTSTRKEREDKLLLRLGNVRHPFFLCVLNQPFNVRFSITHRYNDLNEAEKRKVLRKFLLKLMRGCFEQLWLVIIDDAEYSDQESLQIFDVLTKRDIIFFVLSFGRKLGADYQLYLNFLNRAKVIELTGIDRWYHAGLACQTLNVNGLPAELEKLIQERSFGNPGWIESYLVSLLQIGSLEIVNISKKEANVKGYVLPPLYMLKRLVSSTVSADGRDYRQDRWQMYRASFKDSMISLLEEQTSHQSIDNEESIIAVCNISQSFTYEDVDPEITMDVMILKLFDSLTPLDQLLLKCASVIGETVNRHMLESLMTITSKREIAIENQKMELHNQALKYLQHHTRRCVSCGEGHFAKLLGTISKKDEKRQKSTDIDEMLEMEFEDIRDVHKKKKRKVEMILTALLEFAEVCLAFCNIPQARKLLTESEIILGQLFKSNEDEVVLLPYLNAKIQTLRGQCFLESGSIFEAEQSLEMAVTHLGYKFPKLDMMIDLKSISQLMDLKVKLTCKKDWRLNTSHENNSANYTEQLAQCLTQMFALFRIKGLKKHARLAAIWGLNAALKSNKNLLILCTSYTNMLITAHMYQDRCIIPHLEQKSINLCIENKDDLESQEVNAIAELYAGIFFSRWLRGLVSTAIPIGFVCYRIADTIGSTFLKLLVLPRLIHLLMISCRHPEVVTQLRELEFISHYDLDKCGRTWYYALCADVQLDTGLMIISFQSCERYFLREGEQMISLHDPEAERRYFTSMWLWCIRTEQWEAAKVWSGRSVETTPIMDEHIVAATVTLLKRLEGLLILYVHKINSRNADATITMTQIEDIFKHAKKMINFVKIVIPRYMLLKAYYWMIRSQKNTAMKLLRKLQKICLKMDNKMIYTWAQHCEKAWSGAISPLQTDLWMEISNNKMDKWDEINVNDSNMVIFTFPLPEYLV